MFEAIVHKFPMDAPNDVRPLVELFRSGELDPEDVVAIVAKTEGNGRVNDFTRQYAVESFARCIAEHRGMTPEEVKGNVALIGSGGCEGVMSPHALLFARRRVVDKHRVAEAAATTPRLAIGTAFTRELLPEEVGTLRQVEVVSEAVRVALQDAHIQDVSDVKYVQIKCPLLTSSRINEALARGKSVKTTNTLNSLGYSNGASALGVAIGLGELSPHSVAEHDICARPDLFSKFASSSAGVELMHCEIVIIGNAYGWTGPYRAGHSLLRDLIDADGVRNALRDAGLRFDENPTSAQLESVVTLLGKGTVPHDGMVRGRRTTLLTDSDLNTRPARAVLNATMASVVGDPAVYASAGWGYHQGPVGGGLVAAIVRA